MQNSQVDDGELDRAAVRATILAAARVVVERDGADNLTLSKVSVEAGLPRAAVYRQFTRKEDILMSIASNDLATLARGMRDLEWPDGSETPENAVVVSLQRSPAEPADEAMEPPAQIVDIAKQVSAALLAASPEAAAPSERRLARRAELTRVLELKNSIPAPGDAKTETPEAPVAAAPRADAWLERRLRMFEKGMAAMEARQEQVEKNARAVVAGAEAQIKSLEDTVKELTSRAEATEAKQKLHANEVRAALNETTLRVQTVEGVAKVALAEKTPAPEPTMIAPEPVVEVAHDEPVTEFVGDLEHTEQKPVDAPKAEMPRSMIAEVRKTVVAATAAAAAVSAEARREARAAREKRNRTRFILGGVITLAVFVAAATMAFSKGVADGRREAMHNIVRIEPQGTTVRTAGVTPLDRLTARARAGDAMAEYVVATKYLGGNETTKNPAEAIRWLTLAAAHGLPAAQYLLGTMYTQGLGTKPDTAKAMQWYEAAALQGDRKAMHGLAIAYAQGDGTAQNMPEAVRWFSRAAQLGYVDSQFNLAVLYERGDGVPQSLLDAYKWYWIASRNGDGEAKARVDTLRTQLNADDLSAAEHAASAFQAAPPGATANGTL